MTTGTLKRYVIVRDIPGIGEKPVEELRGACALSNKTISSLNHDVQWVHSYVVKDKTYCIYLAPGMTPKLSLFSHAQTSLARTFAAAIVFTASCH
jgi:hypothetical protein